MKTLELITKHNLNYKSLQQLYHILYGKGNKKNSAQLIEYSCIAAYYAVEAYYTPCTISVVVFEMQGGKKMNLPKIYYVISAIENLGDMRNHILHETRNSNKTKHVKNPNIILKYSKYIYRIYYSIGKALDNKTIMNRANRINNLIIPHRKTGDITKVNFKLLSYENESIFDYIDTFTKQILKYIERCI